MTRKTLTFVGVGVPEFVFNLGLCNFTPSMAKRDGPGPFAAAPIVQGRWDTTGISDVVSLARGTQLANPINDAFYTNLDANQGSIVFWITPEWDGNDSKGHFIYDSGGTDDILILKAVDNFLYLYVGDQFMAVDVSAWTAGTTYFAAVRWDQKNPIDGTNYGCITVNTTDTFGITTQPTVADPAATIYLGNSAAAYAVDSIVEGFTIYRRVLYDGTYGVDAGNGDELTAIYAAGAGADPCLFTGSWGIPLCVPTDSTPGALTTGTGEAWSHPHGSAEIQDTFMSEGGYFSEPYAVGYNGTSTYIDCGSGATLDDIPSGGQMTIGIWVRIDADDDMWTIAKGNFSTNGWMLWYVETAENFRFWVNCVGAEADASSPVVEPDGKWHYVTAFYDDIAKSARVAVDGVWGAADGSVGVYQSDAAANLIIGRRSSSPSYYWEGAIGWAAIWSDDHHVAGTDFIPPRTAPTPGGNLVECWHMDEGTGATAAAQVTTPANDGTITDGTWIAEWYQQGTPVIPQSLKFDGTTTLIDATSGANIDDLPQSVNGMTLEGYFRFAGHGEGNSNYLWQKGSWPGGGFFVYVSNNGQVAVLINYDDTDAYTFASPSSVFTGSEDNVYHHIAVTYDEGGDRKVYVWIDGIKASYDAQTASVGNYVSDAAANGCIGNVIGGARTLNGAAGWQAWSDTVRYTGTFVPNGRSNPRANDANVQLLYAMTDGAGTTVADTSGNGYNGTITMGSGRWLNTPDMETDEPGARVFAWGYNVGSDGADDGMLTEIDDLTAETDYVIRAVCSYGMSGRAFPYIYLWDNDNAAQIGAAYNLPRMTGQHSGGNNSPTLICATGYFTQQLVGWKIYNITDGSSSTITAVSGDRTTVTGVLAGGTDNDWDTNDVYLLRPPAFHTYSSHPNATESIFVFRTPAGCTSIEVRGLNAAGEGVIQWHQVEVQESILDNGDHESLTGGNPDLITGWANFDLDAGDTQSSAGGAGVIHAGAEALEWNPGAINEGMSIVVAGVGDGTFFTLGGWEYGDGNGYLYVGPSGANGLLQYSLTDRYVIWPNANYWKHAVGVLRSLAVNPTIGILASSGAVGDRFSDDTYMFTLDDVTLTCTPASAANSAESGGIRVDGRDSLTQPITAVAPNSGRIRWTWRPRHSAANLVAFDETGNEAYILHADGNATNYITLIATAANTITLEFNDGGGAHNVNWNCAGQVVADTAYSMEIRYSDSWMRLYQDGVLRATINQPVAFALDPQTWTMYWGSEDTPSLEGDAVFAAP